MALRSLIRDENAVNIVTGHILNLIVLMIITGGIAGAFYLYVDSSSEQAARISYTDLGSQIARDITNMYITSAQSQNINITIRRDIPLTLGGKGYRIMLNNATETDVAFVGIREAGLSGYEIITKLNSIDFNSNINISSSSRIVYSGSGEISIGMVKNSTENGTEVWLWIK
ncbi:hypothetical protein ANME2D_01081 [Candidatus Methanoperedens nitroreducens]|uniref:Uncharacterized protein n=1 Tax=Candidatus Methanoperedens nitratireducens TaxID=1392998 RepID=A0A062VBG0_9EURY|nr:hypothetical protein [Candidatus Methanoperedens nitroreducens]KCZ72650.1 hypothetical protein ANME2D_01081 [Candidatus Methanoperedens nitroreducens]MDJ1423418.1 hypothetical protein [Candidatus Methanoperedens sp.]